MALLHPPSTGSAQHAWTQSPHRAPSERQSRRRRPWPPARRRSRQERRVVSSGPTTRPPAQPMTRRTGGARQSPARSVVLPPPVTTMQSDLVSAGSMPVTVYRAEPASSSLSDTSSIRWEDGHIWCSLECRFRADDFHDTVALPAFLTTSLLSPIFRLIFILTSINITDNVSNIIDTTPSSNYRK